MRIASWNVNGYRAVWKKTFRDWFSSAGADLVLVQETKAWPEQLTGEQVNPLGYHSAFAQAERKGYSGVATFTRTEPDNVQIGFGDRDRFDSEGRVLVSEHLGGRLLIANIYFPNGKQSEQRLQYKLDFYEHTLAHFERLKAQGRHIIVSGDYNTAHKEIDLARPKENENTSGFLPVERAWMDRWVAAGWVDTFRMFTSGGGHYSWWDLRTRARERDIGWRIDYHFVSGSLRPAVRSASITQHVIGSDHCPVWVEIDEAAL